MSSPGSIRAAGYLTAGVALLLLVAVFVPLRIGREGRGDSLDPRSWRKVQELGEQDEAFLTGAKEGDKKREGNVRIRVRPRGAEDSYVAPERIPDYPVAASEAVRRACAALRAVSFRAELPAGVASWEAQDPDPVATAPSVDSVLGGLVSSFATATKIPVELRIGARPWESQSLRARARAVAALPALRAEQRADRFLESLASAVDARVTVLANGRVVVAPANEPVPQDGASRRWCNLLRARELAGGEEVPPAWRGPAERALRESVLTLDAAGEPLDRLLTRMGEQTGVSLFVEEQLPPESARRSTTLRVQKLPLGDALRLILEPKGLDFVPEPDGLIVMDAAQAKARIEALDAPHRAADRILERRVEIAVADLAPRKLAVAVEQAAGAAVILDESLWAETNPLDLPAAPRTLRAALDELARRNRLSWRVLDGEIYLFR